MNDIKHIIEYYVEDNRISLRRQKLCILIFTMPGVILTCVGAVIQIDGLSWGGTSLVLIGMLFAIKYYRRVKRNRKEIELIQGGY